MQVGKRKQAKFDKEAILAANAKDRKLIAEAGIKEQQVEIERLKKEKLQANLVPIKEVEETFIEISSKVKSQLARLVAQLPPKLEGLEAVAMIPIIRSEIDSVLNYLSSSFAVKDALEAEVQKIEKGVEDDS